MEKKLLMQDLVEKFGEKTQTDMIIEKSMMLATSLHKLQRIERKEDYSLYNKTYSEVCENIADMRIMIEQAEFLFNTNEINRHYQNKLENFTKALDEF
jgi:predicted choloylglycine hydrolase